MLDIVLVLCRSDNYAPILHDRDTGVTAVVDTPDGAAIAAELDRRGWGLDLILTTHHHGDHTEGHEALKARFRAQIVAPAAEADRIPAVDRALGEGAGLSVCGRDALVIATPGHTRGHVAYYLPAEGVAFVGDTLFPLGCGRLLEDSPAAMWSSLGKLAELPPATRLYCGHEYTQANARFALTIEPDNPALRSRARAIDAARAAGQATVPSRVEEEVATNPFLRAHLPEVKAAMGMETAPAVEVFAEIRRRKDRFR